MTLRLRNSAKAVVVRDGCLLVQRNSSPQDPEGDWMLLPGGGQEPGEPLVDTVRREVFEETGFEIVVGPLLWIREYIGAHHEFAHFNSEEHQIEFMFGATIVGGGGTPTVADTWQVGVDWLTADQVRTARLYPMSLREVFAAYVESSESAPVYHGDVN